MRHTEGKQKQLVSLFSSSCVQMFGVCHFSLLFIQVNISLRLKVSLPKQTWHQKHLIQVKCYLFDLFVVFVSVYYR